ncbi:MAG: ABC transporter ATP-binding protein [Clostridiales bacterium]|nr:ABC transporter ATP-binding protein [Clostridiales bacterium]
MEQLSLRHVYKMYLDGNSSVTNLSVDIGPSEFFVLLGPSGAGKSDLLRMIAGLESVTRGQILWGNSMINELPPEQRPASLLQSGYSLYPNLTVYENIAFRMKLVHRPAPVIRKAVLDTVQLLGIEHLLDRLPKALTPTEKLFTAIARLLIRRPKLLLLDEPMAQISVNARSLAMQKLVRLQKKLLVPLVYATSDPKQAQGAGARVLLMIDGCAVQCGTMEEIQNCSKSSPAGRFLFDSPAECASNAVQKAMR